MGTGDPVVLMTRAHNGFCGGPRVAWVSLGCPKSLIDSEKALGTLATDGFVPCADPREADVVVVNTCSFIDEAREESEDVLRQAVRLKTEGRVRAVVAAGCHAQRLGAKLRDAVPGLDVILGVSPYDGIVSACRDALDGAVARPVRLRPPTEVQPRGDGRLRLTPRHYAYLRLGEGCDHACTFCAIPRFRGLFHSTPRAQLLAEARELAADGARELAIVAQDTTDWGKDLPGESGLAGLLRDFARVEEVDWIRLLYAYPSGIDDPLLDAIREEPRICNYMDVPLQHTDPEVLRRMNRPVPAEGMRAWADRIRKRVPGIVLRTTIIVGFPGETEAAFDRMLDDLAAIRFDRLGCFRFSPEVSTPAARMPGAVPDAVKEERFARVMEQQQGIAFDWNAAQVGRTLDVLVDAAGEEGITGRSYADAPDVDGQVLLRDAPGLPPGTMLPVRIVGAEGYDLVGVPA